MVKLIDGWCSRNQLSVIPAFIARLELLQVFLVNNNRLVSLPEEIGRLRQLMQLVGTLRFAGEEICK